MRSACRRVSFVCNSLYDGKVWVNGPSEDVRKRHLGCRTPKRKPRPESGAVVFYDLIMTRAVMPCQGKFSNGTEWRKCLGGRRIGNKT